MLDVGIAGMGTIGRAVARAIDGGEVRARLVGITSRDLDRARDFAGSLRQSPPVLPLAEVADRADLVVEAATGHALEAIAPAVLGRGKDLMILSVGGLLAHPEWVRLAEEKGCRIHVPSGAIAGLDGVKGACAGRVDRVMIETRKPPKGLAGAPYLLERGIDLDALQAETVIFEGPAAEACQGFPANVNVSAALSLAGLGPDKTTVRIIAVPGGTRNMHTISVEGEFGRFQVEIAGVPSDTNPRTGKLSYLSAIACLQALTAPLRVGT